MRHALRSLREADPSLSRLGALGVLTRLARAAGVLSRRTLVAALVFGSVILSSAGTAPSAAQVMTDLVGLKVVAVAMDPDSPDAIDSGDGEAAPVPDTAARVSAGPDGLIHLQLVPGDNELRYIISIRTLGQPMRQSTCATRAVTGELVLTPDGTVVGDQSKFVADMRTLRCSPPLRDGSAQLLLETQKYPVAEATFDQAPGLAVPLPIGDASCQLIGQQSVHGVTRHAVYATAATVGSGDVTGHATSSRRRSDRCSRSRTT